MGRPRNLHELLDIPTELAQYKDKIINYEINLLEVRSIDNPDDYSGNGCSGQFKRIGKHHETGSRRKGEF